MNYLPSILIFVACVALSALLLYRTVRAMIPPKPTPWQIAEADKLRIRQSADRIMRARRVIISYGIAAGYYLPAQLKAQEQRRVFGNN